MKPQEKATELIKKFGSASIKEVQNTLYIWEYKKLLSEQEMVADQHNEEKFKISLNANVICKRTIKYWNKVKELIKQQLVENKIDK